MVWVTAISPPLLGGRDRWQEACEKVFTRRIGFYMEYPFEVQNNETECKNPIPTL
ncbi:hypothetical protein GCM10007416_02010 [Kroppenstedtia guangzhouensis]|uniref:Uncharacterized protein n=1 Tax=Kroppenstedtia guangzhouensis TaxID=1274356 RepID=A0ABQ1FWW3_9BACL|nr:hypothetical protein GCM10007416_02010 [Kroppenstedtia guangzhouensis]